MLGMVVVLFLSSTLYAQTPAPSADQHNGTPKAASAPAPVHDVTGVWMMRNPPGSQRGFTNYTFTKDPVLTRCDPPGVPRVYFHPYPFELVHTPKYTLMLYEDDHTVRRIYTDGRPIPTDPDLLWMGTSVGHWEGDTTFVVDTVGFNDKT